MFAFTPFLLFTSVVVYKVIKYLQVSAQCLAAKEDGMGYVFMEQCSPSSARQQWIWQHIDEQLLAERQAAEPLEDKV